MFYNHEILTSRKYGVATIWLVATLGSHSHKGKVQKKDIMNVDVVRACGVIVEPEVPMALRLQSNLLAGVCRVYNQQCGYVLTDAEHMRSEMIRLLRVVRQNDQHMDPQAGKIAKRDQLLQSDDPSFHPALIGMDSLPSLELYLNDPSSQIESLFSPRSSNSNRSTAQQLPELDIPSSSVEGGVGFDVAGAFGDSGSGGGSGGVKSTHMQIDDDAPLPPPDFEFDPEGNLWEFDETGAIMNQSLAGPLQPPGPAPGEASARASSQAALDMTEHRADQDPNAMDFTFDIPQDDLNLNLDNVEPLLEPSHAEGDEAVLPTTEHDVEPRGSASDRSREDPLSSPSTVNAAQRKKRQPKVLGIDSTTQIRNSELQAWQNDYLTNMAKANERRLNIKAAHLAKKNARWFTFAGGIGGVGFEALRMAGDKHPLAMFAGDSLYKMLTGADTLPSPPPSRKRSREPGEGEGHGSDSDRRVRPRDSEYGRGAETDLTGVFEDTHMGGFGDDDIEQGRGVGTQTVPPAGNEDISDVMPWNVEATGARSQGTRSHSTGSFRQPLPLSQQQGRLGSVGGSRITSASPLHGRGGPTLSRQGSLLVELPQGAGSSSGEGDGGGFDFGGLGDVDELALDVDPGLVAADRPQWMSQTLDTDLTNFHEFLNNAISESGVHVDRGDILRTSQEHTDREEALDEAETVVDYKKSITFEHLLPPHSNSHIVAAQGLLNILTLATKGMIWVKQSGWQPSLETDDGEPSTAAGKRGEWIFDGDIWLGNEDSSLGSVQSKSSSNSEGKRSQRSSSKHGSQPQDAGPTDAQGSEDELA